MSRYRSFDQNDDTPNHMGDVAIWGVKMRQEPHLVPPGYAAEAINMRFRRGVPETRLGTTMPPWGHRQEEEEEEAMALLNVVITNEQEVDVNLEPDGTLVSEPTWELVQGNSTFVVAEDGMSATVRSSALPGMTDIMVNADNGAGTIGTLVRVRVTPPQAGGGPPDGGGPPKPPKPTPLIATPATNLGATSGPPRPKA